MFEARTSEFKELRDGTDPVDVDVVKESKFKMGFTPIVAFTKPHLP